MKPHPTFLFASFSGFVQKTMKTACLVIKAFSLRIKVKWPRTSCKLFLACGSVFVLHFCSKCNYFKKLGWVVTLEQKGRLLGSCWVCSEGENVEGCLVWQAQEPHFQQSMRRKDRGASDSRSCGCRGVKGREKVIRGGAWRGFEVQDIGDLCKGKSCA